MNKIIKFLIRWWWIPVCIFLIIPNILEKDYMYFVGWFLLSAVTWVLYKLSNKISLELRHKIINVGIGISLFVFTVAIGFNKIIPKQIDNLLVRWAISVFTIFFLIRRFTPKLKGKDNSLESKVKSDLKIYSKTHKIKFPKMLNWVGGFVTPGIPFFCWVNKNWSQKLRKQEAIIHENVHLYYFQNGFIIVFVIFILFASAPLANYIKDKFFVGLGYVSFLAVIGFVFFEYITFRKTNTIGNAIGIKTEKWNKGICKKYFIVYTIQMGILFVIISLITLLFRYVKGLLIN